MIMIVTKIELLFPNNDRIKPLKKNYKKAERKKLKVVTISFH